ncbi:hypothetical protein [Kitasatospora sp. NPDC059571]|uniref:hypothetical protein n=1 Tax=Kitasatospora sp. NPDC059571 TaxID=3346871 RepID=UPI00367DC7A2
MTGVEVAAAMVFAWAVRKARRVGGKADGIVDDTIEELGNRAHDSVMGRLRGRAAVEAAQAEAEQALPVLAPEVRTGLERAIAEALEADPALQAALDQLADAVRQARGGAPLASVANVSVRRDTYSNDTTHTTNNFHDKAVVSSGANAEVNVTF